jgi:hypothetical protein
VIQSPTYNLSPLASRRLYELDKLYKAGGSVTHDEPEYLDLIERWEWPKPKRKRRKRKLTLAAIKKQAAKAGITPAAYTVNLDGSITVVPGQPKPEAVGNELDQWRAKRARSA